MDPLSVAAGVGSLTFTCFNLAKAIGNICTKYKGAPQFIASLQNETKLIGVSLSHLQRVLLSDMDSLQSQVLLDLENIATIDIALTGCSSTLDCLEAEIHALVAALQNGLGAANKAKIVWKDDKFKDIQHQLRGQCSAIGLLLNSLQMRSMTDICRLLYENRPVFKRSAADTESLRASYSLDNDAESFLEYIQSNQKDGVLGDIETVSVYSKRFEFDEIIRGSPTYRKVSAARKNRRKSAPQNVRHEGDLIDLSAPVIANAGDKSEAPPAIHRELPNISKSRHDESEVRSTTEHQEPSWEDIKKLEQELHQARMKSFKYEKEKDKVEDVLGQISQQLHNQTNQIKFLKEELEREKKTWAEKEDSMLKEWGEREDSLTRSLSGSQRQMMDQIDNQHQEMKIYQVKLQFQEKDLATLEEKLKINLKSFEEFREYTLNDFERKLEHERAGFANQIEMARAEFEKGLHYVTKKLEQEKAKSAYIMEEGYYLHKQRAKSENNLNEVKKELEHEKTKSADLQTKLKNILGSLQILADPNASSSFTEQEHSKTTPEQ